MSRRQGLGLALGASLTSVAGRAAGRTQFPPEGFLDGEFLSRGEPMPVVLAPPTAEGPLTGAAIMMLHGSGGLGADMPTFRAPAARWAAMGCVVVMPVYFSADRRAPAKDPVAWWNIAVADAAKWMSGLPGVEPDRQGVFGFSRGGYLAAEVAVRETEIKAVVGVASAGNVRPDDIVRRPEVLLIHASGDPVVRPIRTRHWARVLRDKGVPVEVITLSSPRHNFTDAEWARIFAESERFFLQAVGRPATTPSPPTL
ncbi:MAG: alpha/beta hydrolase fold domain-containing protein [Alphaproteobacteria bacterium]|nr:alpha/beta hydrolase fold domain-containing protein [Alphaproteobacteria bacterium]MBU2291727.1 alpha/beta hydrolase fold domain-containing protein [Alphaproteobacteria bacterium]MBU2417666.1 alpha/beta hydrolase fold domain-containing protein [Alphaproteobacteria bacterium]